ncbi:maltose alpha-D-glucosyltransferase [Streptomyces sp. NPDC018019]|uniref:maltose alpha-D-glucosyltransferase n=1 Tax=Streptomyces sp. NPDC018019 TaxID=3365030 RepID=UPI003793FC0C
MRTSLPAPPPENPPAQPDWFKTAIFYEVLVRAFYDADGDGVGDLKGLLAKLDYLQWLGVDCLWLPPFYASPLRDGGYDISDYRAIRPEFGTMEDFIAVLDAAHARGMRVITDLVVNHTSDQHPWFQHSRQSPHGPFGDFYMWDDDDRKYAGARIIFVDTERSNWAWDDTRGQYYWHRFFSHQPDLNYDNPRVQDHMLDTVRFWLDLGVDGFRMDAVPYLFAREGTTSENLPETHDFLRRVRKVVDEEYPGRVLLAEANQWPQDAVAYFGDPATGGDESHMAFHFPLMPRLFMAIRQESRTPITEVLDRTPPIPAGSQWAIFLRNHDELTLEMVTDEERDYLYAQYATEPRMRANIGIRRRLAPLLGNDRRQLELFTALLLSLPGSPMLYYGDEIGMGDNIWLADRDAVRTPMQWAPGRNGGFSTADPACLYLPVITDSVYGPQARSVEAQRADGASLLHWVRDLIHVRRDHPAFGLGAYREIDATNPGVLAYIREREAPDGASETVLCVYNLARTPQHTDLDLRAFASSPLTELTGGTPFPAIGTEPYPLTLPGYGFYWFTLGPRTEAT